MEYKKEDILEVINPAIVSVSKDRYTKPYYRYFHFKNNKLFAQNGKVLTEFNFTSDLNCFVDAFLFRAVINNSSSTVYLEQEEKALKIKSGNNTTKINTYTKPSGYSFPKEDLDEVTNEIPEGFIEALHKVVSSASKDVTVHVLTGIHLSNGGIVASDRNRISAVKVPDLVMDKGVTLTKEAISLLLALERPKTISIKKDKVEFGYKEDGIISRLISPTISAEYPQKAIELHNMEIGDRKLIELPVDLVDPIKRVILTAPEEIPYVKIKSIGDGSLTISSENRAIGSSSESVPVETNEEFDFNINPKFIVDVLSNCNKLYYKSGDKPLLFKYDNFISIIAPIIKIKEGE